MAIVEAVRDFMEKWVALYVRLSRDDDNEGDSNSIATQRSTVATVLPTKSKS